MIVTKRFDVFQISMVVLLLAVVFVVLYPVWYVLIHSLNNGKDIVLNGHVTWVPRDFTFDNYALVFENNALLNAFLVSTARTVIGTATHVYFSAIIAFALVRTDLVGRKIWIALGTMTLFFSGGLIPTFMLYKGLGLIDNFLVYILPNLFSFFDCIIFMSFFRSVPASISESAKMDGASDLLIFNRIILPLSTPVIATVALWNGVWNWNDFFVGVVFIQRADWLLPIQTFLYKIIATTEAQSKLAMFGGSVSSQLTMTTESIRMATMVVTTVPVMIVYPFLQKYFAQGAVLGSLKE